MIGRSGNEGISRELSASDLRKRTCKYNGLESDGKRRKTTYHANKLPCFVKKREGKTCNDCRHRFSWKCDAFAMKHPEFANECVDFWEVER